MTHKLTPLGILFPASIRNDTEQIFITCGEINDVKKSADKQQSFWIDGNN